MGPPHTVPPSGPSPKELPCESLGMGGAGAGGGGGRELLGAEDGATRGLGTIIVLTVVLLQPPLAPGAEEGTEVQVPPDPTL
mmetsp:Transcript_89692/g.208940  ORF Transcript_89692/g.208940 Transcript_89692/m.208940 type:complete len:82 (+) Transcript_89692:154-399(+)